MVFVDFASSPFLRGFLSGGEYLAGHRASLAELVRRLPGLARAAAGLEAEAPAPRPLAAVLDIDEVLLANIHENVVEEEGFFACDFYAAPGGGRWPRGGSRFGPALPGAAELLAALGGLGVTAFFVSGRAERLREDTIENFVLVGLGEAAGDGWRGRLRLRPDAGAERPGVAAYKTAAREKIAKKYRIVVNVGDQLSDLGAGGGLQWHCAHPFYETPP